MSPLSRALLILAICAVPLAAAPVASANTVPAFASAVTLSTPTSASKLAYGGTQIATNRRGDEVASWLEYGSADTSWAAFKSAGGTWSTKRQLPSIPGSTEPLIVTSVTLDDAGIATFMGRNGGTFYHDVYTSSTIAVVTGTASAWDTPQVLAQAGSSYDQPVLAANGAGDQVLAWRRFPNGRDYDKVLVARRHGNGAFSAPQVFPTANPDNGFASTPAVSINARGDAAVSWAAFTDGVQVAIGKAGAPLAAPIGLVDNPAFGGFSSAVVIAATGDTTVVWNAWSGSGTLVHARRLSAAGALGADQVLFTGGPVQFAPRLVATDAGAVTALWSPDIETTNTRQLWYADAAPGQPFGPAAKFLDADGLIVGDPDLAAFADPAGGLLLAFDDGARSQLAWRPTPTSPFEPSIPVGQGRQAASFAYSGPGRISALSSEPVPALGANRLVARRSTLAAGPVDTAPPVVTLGAVTQSPVTAAGSSVSARFTLSEGAKVTAQFSQLRPGVILGGLCVLVPGGVTVTPATACQKRVYLTPAPTAWFNKGVREITFAQSPKPGSYTLTVTAKDAAGNGAYATKSQLIS